LVIIQIYYICAKCQNRPLFSLTRGCAREVETAAWGLRYLKNFSMHIVANICHAKKLKAITVKNVEHLQCFVWFKRTTFRCKMRLLNVNTMRLEEFFGSQVPLYAILSHCVRLSTTWGLSQLLILGWLSLSKGMLIISCLVGHRRGHPSGHQLWIRMA
jgi:hypothetical protein